MRLSDLISQTILNMLKQSETGVAEIKRNEMANLIGCVPSQINYVISSRFSPEHGFLVESKRGGGGYIKITRIKVDSTNASSVMMHLINSIGNELQLNSARIILENLVLENLISDNAAVLINAAISDSCYQDMNPVIKNKVRAAVFKQTLLAYINRLEE